MTHQERPSYFLNLLRKLSAVSALFLAGPAAYATITIENVGNASSYDSAARIIYGGTAGSNTGCSTGLLDNCTGSAGTLVACNPRRVCSSTILSITFKSDKTTGVPMLANSSGSQVTVGATSVTKGNSTTLTLPWSTLCALLAAPGTSSDCETSDGATDLNKGLQFKIGISAANDSSLNEADDDSIAISVQVQRSMADTVDTTAGAGSSTNGSNGIFDFSVFPGDAKVYLENLAAHANFPVSANGVIYTKVHLLSVPNVTVCTPGLFGNSFVTDSSKTKSVSLDGSELTDDRFFGYENEVSYLFKVALEDRAGNIGQFTDDADCVTAKHVAKPGQVFGLLREQQNCFIATATFGSPLDPTVGTFRSFRDRFLAPSKWGQSLIQFYYTHSPQPAATIRENETLRSISRAALMPFWIFAVISLNYGFMAAVLVFSVLTIAALLAFRALQRHLQKRIGT